MPASKGRGSPLRALREGRRAHGERQYRTEEKASHLVKNGNKMRMRQKKERTKGLALKATALARNST